MKKKLLICVQRDISNVVNWALKDLTSIDVNFLDHLHQLEKIFENELSFSAIVIDLYFGGQSTVPFLKKIKEKSKMKILLIISKDTPKQEVVSLIQNKLVDNVLLRPFNANQLVEAVAKLCNIERPTETPWYMRISSK